MTDDMLAPVLAAARGTWTAEDIRRVRCAYATAERLHANQRRRSGTPYIQHAIEVARITADNGAQPETVCAALLHDVLDGTSYSVEDMQSDFGYIVASQVIAVSQLKTSDIAGADRDVLLLKLADRLHNMRTIQYIAPEKQRNKSIETLRTLAPLANSLGLNNVCRELSQLASTVLYGEKRTLLASLLWVSAILLPRSDRTRWLSEWGAELTSLPNQRSKRRFIFQLILGMPRFASILRTPKVTHQDKSQLRKAAASALLSGTWAAAIANPSLAWAAALSTISLVALTTAVLFTSSEQPARRLRALIESWRSSRRR